MSTEELDLAMDSILGSNNQEEIWKDIKDLKEKTNNKFFFLNQDVEYRFRLLGPVLHTERIYLPLDIFRQLIGPENVINIVSKKDIPSIKLLLSKLFNKHPDLYKIKEFNNINEIIVFLNFNQHHKSCHCHKNEINSLCAFLNNQRDGWQKCTLVNAVSITSGGFHIKILPLIQTFKKSIKDIVAKQKQPFNINGIYAKDIIIKRTDINARPSNRRDDVYNSPVAYRMAYPTTITHSLSTTGTYNFITNMIESNIPVEPMSMAANTKFNIKTDISFSDKKYFLPDKVIEYIIKEGLWDIKKIIESSNNQGKHVFYYKTYDNYKMPKEYMKELMEEMDDKMEQDCLDGIEENMDDLPEDAIENGNQNNSMANLKLNLGEE